MVVVAVKNGEEQCGKRVQDSKKKYYWVFRIDGDEYRMELVCSFLSGKKKVVLNGEEIYNEKDFFNINFEFVHNVNGNCVRLTQNKQNFECRINNMSFTELFENRFVDPNLHAPTVVPTEKKQTDPFAEFGNFMGPTGENTQQKSATDNQFGDFDMNFKFEKELPKEKPSTITETNPVENKENEGNSNDNFQKHFKEFDKQFEDDALFGTNTYVNMSKNMTSVTNKKQNDYKVDTKIGSLFSEIFKIKKADTVNTTNFDLL